MAGKKDLYALLGLDRSATTVQIKSRFYKLSLKYHPDQSEETAKEKYSELLEAYNTLKDPVRRKQYDLQRIDFKVQDVPKFMYKESEQRNHWQEWVKGRYTERDPLQEKPPSNSVSQEAEERENLKIRIFALLSGLLAYVFTWHKSKRKVGD